MLPQNGQIRPQQQPGLATFTPANPSFDAPPYFNIDSTQAAKQMAALSATNRTRINNSRPAPLFNPSNGANPGPFLGGTNPHNYSVANAGNYDLSPGPAPQSLSAQPSAANPASFLDPSMTHQGSNPRQVHPATLKQRQQAFLNALASVMANRNTPLPPALTGVPTPSYDPNSSLWKSLDVSEVGHFRFAGKDINLFQLWGSVFQSGGGHAVSDHNGWGAIIAQFNLPEELPQDVPNMGTTSVASTIAQYYMAILDPFEQYFRNNIQEQQKKALTASRQSGQQASQLSAVPGRQMQGTPAGTLPPQVPRGVTNNLVGTVNSVAGGVQSPMKGNAQIPNVSLAPHQQPAQTASSQFESKEPLDDLHTNGHSSESNVLDQDMQGIKRKIEDEESDGKRTRQKIEPEPGSSNIGSVIGQNPSATSTSTSVPQISRSRQQPSRRKIEYVPLAREVDTYGGRDLKFIEHELGSLPQRRPIRDINDWGTVEIEALTMSLRSRLSVELSYALTTFTLLSTMRGQTPGSGFPIYQCPDLFDEMLDLLEDIAFGNVENLTEMNSPTISNISTNRELIHIVQESQGFPFAGLRPQQGSKDASLGPRQRPGNIILGIINIVRNLATVPDNVEFISRHTRLIDLILRVCTIVHNEDDKKPSPASPSLSLGDLIAFRRDTLYTLSNIAGNVRLLVSSPTITARMASRIFELISSYLVDLSEAISPFASVQLAGLPSSGHLRPPLLADIALEVFSRLSQTDANRQVFARSIPQAPLLRLFEALVHRLPVVDADFQLMTRDIWLSYLEKIILAIYSLAFLAPPVLKEKVKADRRLGFKPVMFRLIQKFLMSPNPDGRGWFIVCTRRAIETMKVLDDAEDSFDTSQSIAPTMSFGMGFGDVGEKEIEPGTGLLGGHRASTWDMLMVREVCGDEVMFGELESLARVECCCPLS